MKWICENGKVTGCRRRVLRSLTLAARQLARLASVVRLLQLAREQPQVAEVTLFADLPQADGFFHGAALLVHVGAIGEGAHRHVGAKLREEALDLLGDDVPERELANAG